MQAIQDLLGPPVVTGDTIGICCPTRYTYNTDEPYGCLSYLETMTLAYFFTPAVSIPVITSTDANLTETISVIASISIVPVTTITATSFISGVATSEPATSELASSATPSSVPSAMTSSSGVTLTGASAMTGVGPGIVYASGIQIQWKSTDFPEPPHLSSGAIAGISISVILAILIPLGIGAWLCLRRRSKHRDAHASGYVPKKDHSVDGGMSELPQQDNKDIVFPASPRVGPFSRVESELDARGIQHPAEMESTSCSPVHELYVEPTPIAKVVGNSTITPFKPIQRKPVRSPSLQPAASLSTFTTEHPAPLETYLAGSSELPGAVVNALDAVPQAGADLARAEGPPVDEEW
jgi:hypothetical protein